MSVFRTAGLMCADPGNAHKPGASLPEIRAMGYSFMSPQATNGTTENVMAGTLEKGTVGMDTYRDRIRQAGLKFTPWSKLYGGDVAAQADIVAGAINWLKPDGWVLNPETEYKDDPTLNRKFVDALKAGLAARNVPLDSLDWCFCPLGGAAIPAGQEVSPWAFNYDVSPWLEFPDIVCAPESYWASSVPGAAPEYRPLNCAVQWVEKKLWPRDRMAFTLGWWNPAFATAAQYFADIDKARARYTGLSGGFMLYLADQAPLDVIKAFGAGAANGYADAPAAPVVVTDADARAQIVEVANEWQATRPPYPKARITIARRIASMDNTDAKWATTGVRDKIAALLDEAGVAP